MRGRHGVYNRLDGVFDRLKVSRRKALIAYLSAGHPSFKQQKALIQMMQQEGVDILELGIPFSDPIADGPTIQASSQKSLDRGTTLTQVLRFSRDISKVVDIPIIFMSYLNPILSYGIDAFARDARTAGVAGVIVPDQIPEEASELSQSLRKQKIHLIHLVAPTTPAKRQKEIASRSGGFLYAVSVTGVTGARKSLPVKNQAWFRSLRRMSPVPVCIGFGISSPKQVRELRKDADGFIVGSALINLINDKKHQQTLSRMRSFVRSLAKECRHGR